MNLGNIIGVGFLLVCVGLLVFVCVMCFIVEPIVYKVRQHRIDKYHPMWNTKSEELHKLSSESVHIYNREIAPLKRTIDHAIKYELPYLTEELKARKNNELEAYRKHIAMYQQICDGLDEQANEIREWLRAYNKEHHICKEWD